MAGLAALMLTVGCATTGDPRQGGLLGWNEGLARDRQYNLQQQEARAQQEALEQQQRSVVLSRQEASLSTEASSLRVALRRLLQENDQLDTQLRELMRREQVGTAETVRLRSILAENARLRKKLHAAPPTEANPADEPQVAAVHRQNAQLHREVLHLLNR